MAQANSINASTAGILGNTGTAFTGTSATAHNLILGGATSSTLVKVAPSATSGVPVISQGASSDPTFSTMVVAGGGFGVTSNTAYAVLAGGTTSTNPVQSIASVGSVSQVLTSNGAGALPTMQTFTPTLSPNSVLIDYDDFLSYDIVRNIDSVKELVTATSHWNYFGFDPVNGTTLSTNPGIISSPSMSSSGFALNQNGRTAATPWFVIGGGAISINWVFNLSALSISGTRYTLYAGMARNNGSGLGTDGVFFTYVDTTNSGQWVINCRQSNVMTSVNTTVAATTSGYHNFGITVNAAGTSVSFTIDGVSVGSAITTNIPTLSISPYISIARNQGTIAAGTLNVDLYYMQQTLTSSR